MKINKKILTKNPCYKAKKTITVKGLMLHSVGCSQPSAMVFVNRWNSEAYNRACVHGFIDANNGEVYQTLPWNHRGWHCGDSGNNTHIGVEMCESSYITYTSGSKFTIKNKTKAVADAKRTYNTAVELFAQLCKDYKLDPMKKGVIVSHKEGHELGIASDHGDPEHYWKGLGLKYTMDTFRKAVKSKMTSSSKPVKKESPAFEPFKVKVTCDVLRVRAGAGTNYKINLRVYKGDVYTIVDKKNNWGKLKSGAGWICLDYTKKV